MWRLLHRAIDLFADSGHAKRQTGRDSVRSVAARPPLRAFRQARAARSVRQPPAHARDVRNEPRRGAGVFDEIGEGDVAERAGRMQTNLGFARDLQNRLMRAA